MSVVYSSWVIVFLAVILEAVTEPASTHDTNAPPLLIDAVTFVGLGGLIYTTVLANDSMLRSYALPFVMRTVNTRPAGAGKGIEDSMLATLSPGVVAVSRLAAERDNENLVIVPL